MVRIKSLIMLSTLLMAAVQMFAQGPNDSGTYYQQADGSKGQALKTALYGIIKEHGELGYGELWEAFKSTDAREDGKVWDMYSGITNYNFVTSGSNYKKEGDCYNREHSMPKSWFNDETPMYTDLVHLVPTDGYVNGKRANYPSAKRTHPHTALKVTSASSDRRQLQDTAAPFSSRTTNTRATSRVFTSTW